MAAVTTNYGFDVPTSSDLVKNGATQIALLGQDLDTFLFRPITDNFLINGNFDIWQRGTSFSNPSNVAYTADRWNNGGSAGGTTTITRESTGAPTGAQYCMRTAYGASSSFSSKSQIIETANASQLWGKTVTLSIKLRRNASFSTNLRVVVEKSVTVDASLVSTWVEINSTVVTNAQLPTGTTSADWYTHTVTVSIPNDGTANSLRIRVAEVAAQGSGAYYEIAQAQLEMGSQATPFNRAGSTVGGELAMCQRYYFRATVSASGQRLAVTAVENTTTTDNLLQFPVTMRTNPTALEQSGTASDYSVRAIGASTVANAVPTFLSATTTFGHFQMTVATGLVAGNAGSIRANSANAYLGWSAEL